METKKSKLILLNGGEFLTDISLPDLYVMWSAVKRGYAIVKLEVTTMDGIHDLGLDLRRLDGDRTFGDALVAAYPSMPPACCEEVPFRDTEPPPQAA